jgi:hypothetical protein
MKNQQKRNKNKVKKKQNGHLNSKWKTQGTKIIITF